MYAQEGSGAGAGSRQGKSEAKVKGRWRGEIGARGEGVAKVGRGMKGIFSKIS